MGFTSVSLRMFTRLFSESEMNHESTHFIYKQAICRHYGCFIRARPTCSCGLTEIKVTRHLTRIQRDRLFFRWVNGPQIPVYLAPGEADNENQPHIVTLWSLKFIKILYCGEVNRVLFNLQWFQETRGIVWFHTHDWCEYSRNYDQVNVSLSWFWKN